MKTLSELQEDRAHAIKSCEDIANKAKKDNDRAFTPEEKAELANLQQDVARLDGEINERQIKDRYEHTIATQVETLAVSRREVPAADPCNGGELPKPDVVPYQRRVGKLQAFRGPDGERRAYLSGKFLMAALFGNQKADRWCTHNGLDWRALAIGTNTAGGFLVPEEMSTAIIDLREEYGVFRRECDVMPMTRDMMTIPRRAGGVTATFTGENAALTESDPTFNQVTLSARKLGVLTRISSELSEDAIINIADWCAKEFAWAFAKKEDDCGFKGDGTTTYGGIVGLTQRINDGTHTASIQDATSGDDQFAELIIDDLEAMVGKLPLYAHDGAKWYISQLGWATSLQRLAFAAGGNTVQTFESGMGRAFLGYPVVITQSLPTTTAAQNNAVMLLFGNLRQTATLGDRREIVVSTSPDRYFEYDQVGIKATQRFDIACHDLGDTSTAGPMIGITGNT